MQVAADRHTGLPDLANFCPDSHRIPDPHIDLREVRIQREQAILMLDHDQVTIEIRPGRVDCFGIWARKQDRPARRGIDRRPAGVGKLDSVMWLARPVRGRGIEIAWIHFVIGGRMYRPLQDEMSVGNASVHTKGITSGLDCRCNR